MKSPSHLARLILAGGLLLAGPVAGANFPLTPSPSNRYLVDQAGTPFLIQGDSPWELIVGLNNAEVIQYLEDRRLKGFNTLIVQLIEHYYQSASSPYQVPTNNLGQPPFLTPGDFSTPNEAYFANADWVIDQAAARGMAVVLFPCYVGYPGSSQGWYDHMLANGTSKCAQFGQYVGRRYKNKPNILWGMYGDHDPQAEIQPLVDALSAGIRSEDTNHVFTVHLQRNHDVKSTLTGDTSWLQLNSVYSDSQTYEGCLTAYAQTPAMPLFLIEGYYEGENGSTPQSLRAQAYWANLSGACGQVFGNNPLWGFFSGWQSELDSVGANDMTHAGALFLSRPWTNLVPDTAHVVVTAGYGSYGDTDYVTAALASNGETLIAYLPSGGAVTVDLTKLSGSQAQAWWYDPRNGIAASIGGFPTTQSQSFQPPTTDDWLLVIDNASSNFLPPGTVAPASLQVISRTLPNGWMDGQYSAQLLAAGGTEPYVWALALGALPPGLSLGTNGVLSGVPDMAGKFDFTVQVTDAHSATAAQPFSLVIAGADVPPTISAISNQTINAGGAAGPLAFTVGDAETAAGSLIVSGGSSNASLVPAGNIVFGGSESNRTVTVRPLAGRSGTATITVTVNDGLLSTSTSFLLTVNATAQPTGLVAAYSFNEGSGAMAMDASGNGNNGTVEGATWTTAGKYGGPALSFDGSSQVTVPDSISLDLTTGMTLEAWVFPAVTLTSWSTVVMKEQNTELVYAMYADSPINRPSTWIYTSGEQGFSGPAPLPANTWSHLAATYDGATLRLYVNGALAGSHAAPGSMVKSSHELSIGGNGVWGEHFRGTIDEVRIYNRVLIAAEIQADMSIPIGSSPHLSVQTAADSRLRISFNGPPGLTCRIESTADLNSGAWQTIGSVTVDASGTGVFHATVTSVSSFYRTAYP